MDKEQGIYKMNWDWDKQNTQKSSNFELIEGVSDENDFIVLVGREIIITPTIVRIIIEDTKKLIRQNAEKDLFNLVNMGIAVNVWALLKDLEDKLKSGSFEEKEVEESFDTITTLYKIAFNNNPDIPEQPLEDMEVTIADSCHIFNEARALLKKYILEDKRQQAVEVAWLVSSDYTDVDEINVLYQKEFGK